MKYRGYFFRDKISTKDSQFQGNTMALSLIKEQLVLFSNAGNGLYQDKVSPKYLVIIKQTILSVDAFSSNNKVIISLYYGDKTFILLAGWWYQMQWPPCTKRY